MPKQKTHSGLKKRLKITATGKVMRGHAYRGHMSASKTHKQVVQLRKEVEISKSDHKRIKQLIANMK